MSSTIVLGGGIAGLTAAYRLAEQGVDVTLVEATEQLGGLGRTFDLLGKPFEQFYHTTTDTDERLIQLAEDVGLHDQFDMHITKMGMTVGSRHYAFNTAIDLLRFTALPLVDRIRLGAGGKSLRLLGRGKDLDNMTAEQWLRPIIGDTAWERVLAPMFGMKFGGHMPPALYLYERLARESNVSLRAYPKVGYRGLADGIGRAIEREGGTVLLNTPVHRLHSDGQKVVVTTPEGDMDAQYAVSTLPIPLLKHITLGADENVLRDPVRALPDLGYMGVINMLVLSQKAPTGLYWAFVTDSDTEYEGRIEMSALTGIEHFHGLHGTYVMKYLDRRDPLYSQSDAEIKGRWLRQFYALHPHLRGQVEHVFVFRTPFVEPVWPLGYSSIRPSPRIGDTPLFMATTAQSYPMVTSWNSATVVAERTTDALLQSL